MLMFFFFIKIITVHNYLYFFLIYSVSHNHFYWFHHVFPNFILTNKGCGPFGATNASERSSSPSFFIKKEKKVKDEHEHVLWPDSISRDSTSTES